jgi:predicted nucleic acid-binding protein
MILVDTSIWIDYFKGNQDVSTLNDLIDSNSICTNELILAELIPSMVHKKEEELKKLLEAVKCVSLNIVWKEIIFLQSINLANGLNKVGIPDLIITQNAIQNNLEIFTKDVHFKIMKSLHGVKLFNK